MSNYYVTTPIYYANGEPHIGSAYTTSLADMLARFNRFLGKDVFFLTGMDEHGDKVAQAAAEAGKSSQQYVDDLAEIYRKTWKALGLDYSRFIRTTDQDHKDLVRALLQKVYDKGDIYFGEYGGNYCVGCERFLTDKELVDGKCPDHQTVPKFVKEQNYFFKMSKYQDRLIEHITKISPDFIRPERYKNEVLGLLRQPLEDLCISRPKSRLTWGIELPFDDNYVTYVWFDALINYLTGVDYPNGENYQKFWPSCEHLIGKDIVKPHAVFWPTMLMAADIPLYQHLTVHGYWLAPNGKMSKSLGNVVDPIAVSKEFSLDVFRYYIFREMSFGLDGVFSNDTLETRYNADLANNLGNLSSRTLAMVHKYRDGIVPTPGTPGELEIALRTQAHNSISDFLEYMNTREINRAIESIWTLIDNTNVFIDRTKPWALAKLEKTDPTAKAALDSSLYTQVEALRIIAALISPIMPDTARKITEFLGYSPDDIAKEHSIEVVRAWGHLKAGTKVQVGETLFPRREKPVATGDTKVESPAEKAGSAASATAETTATPTINYDDFAKVDLRVGQILTAERIAKSEKLLKLQVDLGPQIGQRQILAGIAKYYEPEAIIGRKVAVVANLKPAKLMGIESQGMLLAGSDDAGNLELVTPGSALPPGSTIR